MPHSETEISPNQQTFGSTGNLPELIRHQIEKLNELDNNVKLALEAATKAESAAKSAKQQSAGRGLFSDPKRIAIEHLQSAGLELADAVQSSAKAQKTGFEFQQRLADITTNLFGLGIQNIAARQTVIRELEARLKGASEEAITALARQEILGVVRQLKQQEGLRKSQEALGQKQNKLSDDLASHDKKSAICFSRAIILNRALLITQKRTTPRRTG